MNDCGTYSAAKLSSAVTEERNHDLCTCIIQVLLALLFLFAGGTKLIIPPAELVKMGSPNQVVLPVCSYSLLACVMVGDWD